MGYLSTGDPKTLRTKKAVKYIEGVAGVEGN